MSQSQHTDPIIGQKFGNVVAQSILGRGGMGAVYLGYHPGLDMKVAIKLLPDLFVGKREMVERFLREARVSGRLQHPNIVRTLDVGQDHGVYYLVMEYVEGVDAQRLLDKETRFSPMRAVNIAGFVARALGEAHEQGIMHRDVKPANILIARDGKVKVTDFGLARSITNTAAALTLSNQVVGTPNYMAPEQIKSMDVDARVDIYALGMTFWQFITGRLPFDGPTPMAVLLNVVGETLEMPDEFFRPLPKDIREAIVAMTAKDPRRRLPNIAAVLAVLKKARDALRQAGMDSTAPISGGAARSSSPAVKDPNSGFNPRGTTMATQFQLPTDSAGYTKPLGAPPPARKPPGK